MFIWRISEDPLFFTEETLWFLDCTDSWGFLLKQANWRELIAERISPSLFEATTSINSLDGFCNTRLADRNSISDILVNALRKIVGATGLNLFQAKIKLTNLIKKRQNQNTLYDVKMNFLNSPYFLEARIL